MNQKITVNYDANIYKKKKFNILIIDDDQEVLQTLKYYFEYRGHNVCIVDEGARGLSQMSLTKFDIIFLDYHLDNDLNDKYKNAYFDGVVVTECIKDNNILKCKRAIIFAYTGDSSREAVNKFKQAGMDGVIYKPIDECALDKIMTSLEINNGIDKYSLGKVLKQCRGSVMVF